MIAEDARHQVEEELLKSFNPAIWDYLIEKGHVGDYIYGESDLDKLVREYEKLALWEGRRGEPARWEGRRGEPARLRGELHPKESKRWEVLNRILAGQASRMPLVVQYRRSRLSQWPGRVLPLDKVSKWIVERAEEEGAAYKMRPMREPVSPDGGVGFTGRGGGVAWWYPPRVSAERRRRPHGSQLSLDTLLWDDGDGSYGITIVTGGVLYSLKEVARDLVEVFGCAESGATTFVLTGIFPGVLLGSYDIVAVYSPAYSRARISVTVDPSASPEEVAGLYRQARQRLGVQRNRPFSDRILTVLEFAHKERAEGMPWEAVRRLWNREHPEWRYDYADLLSRDYHRAERKLLRLPRKPWLLATRK